jgi:anti-anti-sigma regulatory factor
VTKKKITTAGSGSDQGLGHDPLAWLSEEPTGGEEAMVDPATNVSKETDDPELAVGILKLGQELTIQVIDEVRDSWLQELGQNGDLTIDAADLEQVDGAGIQLLLSLVQTIEARGNRIKWSGISDALSSGAKTVGLAENLKLDQIEVTT